MPTRALGICVSPYRATAMRDVGVRQTPPSARVPAPKVSRQTSTPKLRWRYCEIPFCLVRSSAYTLRPLTHCVLCFLIVCAYLSLVPSWVGRHGGACPMRQALLLPWLRKLCEINTPVFPHRTRRRPVACARPTSMPGAPPGLIGSARTWPALAPWG